MRKCVDCMHPDHLMGVAQKALPDTIQIWTHGKRKVWSIGGGLDCETTKTDDEYSYVYIWQLAIGETVYYGRYLDSLPPFLAAINKRLVILHNRRIHKKPKQYPRLIVYDCNLGYEWAHLKRQFAAAGEVHTFSKTPRRPLIVNIGECVEIREALGVWGYSLANVADTYTQHKKMLGDLDYSKQRHSETPITEAEWGYIENDVLILSELIPIAHERFRNQSIPLTQTGIIREAAKHELQKTRPLKFEREKIAALMPDTLEEYQNITTLLFCGGLSHSALTAVMDTSREPYEHVVCADLTSDYPAQMFHQRFPAGRMLSNLAPGEMVKYPHWWCLMTLHNVCSKDGHTLISHHKCLELSPDAVLDNGRVYSADTVTVYVTEVDYRNIKLMYTFDEAIECCDCHAFTKSEQAPQHLLKVLGDAYRTKNELKQNGKKDTQEYTEAKKLVNGCYGMTATKIYAVENVYDAELGDIIERPVDKDYKALIKDVWLSPWIAIYTTAYAREILCAFIAQYPELICQYDTDSIYFRDDQPLSAELRQTIADYNTAVTARNRVIFGGDKFFDDLGTWDVDPPCDRFKCLGAKRYLKQTGDHYKLTCAGCKPDAFLSSCERRGVDPFDEFTPGMLLLADDSKKTTLKYHDKPHDTVITDYLGESRSVHIETCGVITEIPFAMCVSEEWLAAAADIYEQQRFLGYI